MFGIGETFEYVRCAVCGTLQICEIPADMSRYYAADSYYSFLPTERTRTAKSFAKRLIANWMIGRPSRYPKSNSILSRAKRASEPWIAAVPGLAKSARILDVGCGDGARLMTLKALGFTDLHGSDPFVSVEGQNAAASNAISISAKDLKELDSKYDLITFHHSLEHVAAPRQMLVDAREKLTPGGHILVRIPILQEWVWEQYGVNWAQLDPPRHFHLFAVQAFLDLADDCGLDCVNYGYDGQGWALAWSEAIDGGMTMHAKDGSPSALPFTNEQIRDFDRRAIALNASGDGESAYFVLRIA